MSYTATVHFADSRGRPQDTLTYVLDLNFLFGLMQLTEYGLHDGAKALMEVRDTMKKWTDHFNGLRVYVIDEDARQFSDQWQRKKGGRRPSMAHPIPAGRPTPSRFDRHREPIWRRIYWAVRLEQARREQIHELEAKAEARPDLDPMLREQIERLRSSGLGRFRPKKDE
jgi:hypothetical protein